MNRDLAQPVSDGEIRKAVKEIKSDSSPGADGMTGHFFQSFWDITGDQVTAEVKLFFEAQRLPHDWNFTQICLLPKKPNPHLMTDLRPISLCSVSYKIVSRILCSRLKKILPYLVSETQGAFVAGRLISDNLLIAHEMIHGLRTNPSCSQGFLAIKTDMSKAYDKMEWAFLEELLSRMGFDKKWIEWVMLCVRSVSYTVLLNGQTHGHITPERGLRQGDPLSPFLFILCAEALVHVMNQAELERKISGMRLTKHCPSIQHLLFADDSLFLCRATLKECSEFLHCLTLYGQASGQEINFQKSSVTFGKDIDPIMKHLLAEILNIENEGGAGSYLGLPECFSGSKRQLLNFITEKLDKRLHGWYAKMLSLGGKEILLKSIAMALPVYAMSCFRLSKHQCQKITSAMASFWWYACEKKRKIHWVSWQNLCKSKEEGGMGFRDIEGFNQALLAKQAWRLLNEPNSLLAKLYKGRYYSNKSFLESGKGIRPSYAWRSIKFGKELLVKGLGKSVGNGESTMVWSEKWLFDKHPRRPMNKQTMYDIELRVADLMDGNRSWDMNKLQELFPVDDVKRICDLQTGNTEDRSIWAYTKHGSYTVKSGYWLLSQQSPPQLHSPSGLDQQRKTLLRRIWKLTTSPKIRIFWWRAISGALAVADRLRSRGIQLDNVCKVCQGAVESINHVLFHCSAASEILESSNMPKPLNGFSASLEDNLAFLLDKIEDPSINTSTQKSIPWSIWNIWKRRNAIVMANSQEPVQLIANRITEEAHAWHAANNHATIGDSVSGNQRLMVVRWLPPPLGTIKCNVHANWRNADLMSGGAWLARDHNGMAIFHARDAFLRTPNRMTVELLCIEWALRSLRDIRVREVIIASDFRQAIEALSKPTMWPRYRSLLKKILDLRNAFQSCSFAEETVVCNSVSRDIAKSVNRYGKFQSYLAMGGPAWLHTRLQQEDVRSI